MTTGLWWGQHQREKSERNNKYNERTYIYDGDSYWRSVGQPWHETLESCWVSVFSLPWLAALFFSPEFPGSPSSIPMPSDLWFHTCAFYAPVHDVYHHHAIVDGSRTIGSPSAPLCLIHPTTRSPRLLATRCFGRFFFLYTGTHSSPAKVILSPIFSPLCNILASPII